MRKIFVASTLLLSLALLPQAEARKHKGRHDGMARGRCVSHAHAKAVLFMAENPDYREFLIMDVQNRIFNITLPGKSALYSNRSTRGRIENRAVYFAIADDNNRQGIIRVPANELDGQRGLGYCDLTGTPEVRMAGATTLARGAKLDRLFAGLTAGPPAAMAVPAGDQGLESDAMPAAEESVPTAAPAEAEANGAADDS